MLEANQPYLAENSPAMAARPASPLPERMQASNPKQARGGNNA
jgi:hypothetical protein